MLPIWSLLLMQHGIQMPHAQNWEKWQPLRSGEQSLDVFPTPSETVSTKTTSRRITMDWMAQDILSIQWESLTQRPSNPFLGQEVLWVHLIPLLTQLLQKLSITWPRSLRVRRSIRHQREKGLGKSFVERRSSPENETKANWEEVEQHQTSFSSLDHFLHSSSKASDFIQHQFLIQQTHHQANHRFLSEKEEEGSQSLTLTKQNEDYNGIQIQAKRGRACLLLQNQLSCTLILSRLTFTISIWFASHFVTHLIHSCIQRWLKHCKRLIKMHFTCCLCSSFYRMWSLLLFVLTHHLVNIQLWQEI